MKAMISAVTTGLLSLNLAYADTAISDIPLGSDQASPAASLPVRAGQSNEDCVWEMSLQTGGLLTIDAAPLTKTVKLSSPERGRVDYSSEDDAQWFPRTQFGLQVSPFSMTTIDAGNKILNAWGKLSGSVLEATDVVLKNGTSFMKTYLKAQAQTAVRLHVEMADATKCPAARIFAKYSGSGSVISRASSDSNCSAASKIKIAGSLSGDHTYTMMPGNTNSSSHKVTTKYEVTDIKVPLSLPLVGGGFGLNEKGPTVNLAGLTLGSVTKNKATQSGDLAISGNTQESSEELPYTVIWNSLLDIEMSAATEGEMSTRAHALVDAGVTHNIDSFKGVLPVNGKYGPEDFSLETGPQKRDYYGNIICDLPLLVKAGGIKQVICVNSFPVEPGSKPAEGAQLELHQRFLLRVSGAGLEIKIMDKGVSVDPVRGVTVTR